MHIQTEKENVRFEGPAHGLTGSIQVPGDKSISHRSLLLGAIAEGTTEVRGLLEAEDCLATLRAMQMAGAGIKKQAPGEYEIAGCGLAGLQEPEDILDLGNSGTATRLMIGLLAGYPITCTLTGDASVRRRPMLRVVDPIRKMGATILGRENGAKVPLSISGSHLNPIHHISKVASAQVKSAVLLAGLRARGITTVTEPALSRDHSERMLAGFGAKIEKEGLRVSIQGGNTLKGCPVQVPGDISSAAFFIVAGLIIPDSQLTITNIGLNPTRTGLIDALVQMGAGVRITRQEEFAGELIGDLEVATSELKGIEIGGESVPRMIDEFPIFALAAARAEGKTIVRDAEELRYKESDRISALARQMKNFGIEIEEKPDGFVIEGPQSIQGGQADSEGDHRIAMTACIAALLARGQSEVKNISCVKTSFPIFFELLHKMTGAEQ
jgi:3-phosphoshikimate 1-carboxyvinyltransferase